MAANDPVTAVVAAGSGVAKEISGRRARARLDSATALVDVAGLLSGRTLDRTSRYLATRPTANSRDADFVLELNVHNSGIDVRGQNAAYLFMSATAVLLDARTGREIWSSTWMDAIDSRPFSTARTTRCRRAQ